MRCVKFVVALHIVIFVNVVDNINTNYSCSAPEFPIVGIGASAGGIKALQEFFDALPTEALKMTFVVIVHLDPHHQSELAAILASRTAMPVHQVNAPMALESGCVYVIAPDRRLQIANREISSVEFDEPRGQRAPIDFFFRSLAQQHGDGFAIILTGAGADGAVGVKAVKEAGGLILVQDPSEAEYPSMPRSAIATGAADFILPVREIATQLVPLMNSKLLLQAAALAVNDEDKLQQLLKYLRAGTGHDFSKYKRSTVLRRVGRRMQVHRFDRIDDYLAFTQANIEELRALFADLLISVTAFYRDPAAFEVLAREVIPQLFESKTQNDEIRIWVPGCATGEEAYSIAILLIEEAHRREFRPQLQVFASDLDTGALATAREGVFSAAIAADVPEERLRRFFEREGDHYRVKREVRDILLFATHSLLKDPPFSRLDMISCRNLLIYLDRELQHQAFTIFAYALHAGGFLFLGSSENADHPPGVFEVIDRESRIFRSRERRSAPASLSKVGDTPIIEHLGIRPTRTISTADATLHWQALEDAAPPSVLINNSYEVLHLSETAGRYLQHPRGPTTRDLAELVRPELRIQLLACLHQAFELGKSMVSMPVAVTFNGIARQVYLQVKPVKREAGLQLALVLFIEGEEIPDRQIGELQDEFDSHHGEEIRQLREQLRATRERLKLNMEKYETANEELRAANEEMQSIGEEYRSTAEELETSKEELQSVNEELQTVNNELKSKLDSVSRAHSDLQNLITATDVGTVFLDPSLQIRRFTPRIADLFNITPSDEGRPITDFTHHLKYEKIIEDATRILEDLGSYEHEVESDTGRWYLMRIRPYRTVLDKIDGVVITFVDITSRRSTEAILFQSEARLRLATEAASLGILDYDPVADQMWWDDRAREIWNVESEVTTDLEAFWAVVHPDDAGMVRQTIADALKPGSLSGLDCTFRIKSAQAESELWVRMTGKAFFETLNGNIVPVRLVSTAQDVSDIKLWESHQRLLLAELAHRVKNMLSVVQAMARKTLRGLAEDQALKTFEARLLALSAAHELLTENDWRGADLATLVQKQVLPHLGGNENQIQFVGPKINLPASMATPFGLLIHELATNAVKYGSLREQSGSVKVDWDRSWKDGTAVLNFRWEEKDGPTVNKPERVGFGSFVIEHGLPEASIHREFLPTGLVCTIELPFTKK